MHIGVCKTSAWNIIWFEYSHLQLHHYTHHKVNGYSQTVTCIICNILKKNIVNQARIPRVTRCRRQQLYREFRCLATLKAMAIFPFNISKISLSRLVSMFSMKPSSWQFEWRRYVACADPYFFPGRGRDTYVFGEGRPRPIFGNFTIFPHPTPSILSPPLYIRVVEYSQW